MGDFGQTGTTVILCSKSTNLIYIIKYINFLAWLFKVDYPVKLHENNYSYS